MAVSFRRRLIPPLLLLLLLLLIHAASVDAVAQQEEDRWQEKDGWQDLATERSGQSDLKRASRRVKSARSSELCAGAPCAPARPFFRPPTREPCNAGGGAVVYSSHCAPFPYSSVVGIGESYSNRMQGGASGPFDVQSVGLPLAHPAVAGGTPVPVGVVPNTQRRQAWIASAIAAGVAAPGRGAAMPVWSESSVPSVLKHLKPRGSHKPQTSSFSSSAMEDYIRKGVAAHSSMASPVAVQPIYDSQGHVIHSPPRLNRAQLTNRLMADESAIHVLTKDMDELVTANQYLMTQAALGARPGPPGYPGPPGRQGPPGVSIYEGPSEDAEEDKDTEEATVSGKDKKQGKASER